MVSLRYRALKAADTIAYLGLFWLTWRFLDDELHWKLAIGAAGLSGAWLALTSLRMNRLFTTYFDILSRLEVVLPCGLGIGLALFAALDTHFVATRVVASAELMAWGVIVFLYRRNRRRFVRQGHGPVPAGCWVSPPAEALQPGDLILTSGMVAARLRESVGHGETVIRARDGMLLSFTSRMDRGALLHGVEAFTASLRRSGHYIVLRLRERLTPDQVRRAEEIALEMIEENRSWSERANRHRRAILARLPLPAAWRERIARRLHASGYDWLGLFMGRLAKDRWTCIGACLELYERLGLKTNRYGTGLLGFGTTLFDPIMPVRFLSDPAFRLLREQPPREPDA
jgi:signal transduction histidine kinase